MKTMHRAGRAAKHNGHGHQGIVEGVRGRFSDLADEAMSVEGEIFDAAKKRGGELLVSAQHQGQKALTGTERWIKKNPSSAVGVAFIIGLVLRSWFTRNEE